MSKPNESIEYRAWMGYRQTEDIADYFYDRAREDWVRCQAVALEFRQRMRERGHDVD